MKLTNNSVPKPDNFIWKVGLSQKENDRLVSTLAAFSGVKLRHGKYIVKVKRGCIESVDTVLGTVVQVDGAEESKNPVDSTVKNAPPKPTKPDKGEEKPDEC